MPVGSDPPALTDQSGQSGPASKAQAVDVVQTSRISKGNRRPPARGRPQLTTGERDMLGFSLTQTVSGRRFWAGIARLPDIA
jgi:hypothetical protein